MLTAQSRLNQSFARASDGFFYCYGTVTFTDVLAVACVYLSLAITVMWWLPEPKLNLLANWSCQRTAFFTPSIQTCNWTTPAGEFPDARTSRGELTVLPDAGAQILAASFAELGGAQFLYPPVCRATSAPPKPSSLM